MLSSDRLELVTGPIAPGSLVYQANATLEGPWLALDYQGQPNILHLGKQGLPQFALSLTTSLRGPRLILKGWRLEVEQSSAYSAAGSSYAVGDAYVTPEGWGLVAQGLHTETLVSLDGQMATKSPDYAKGFVGFKSWQIVVNVDQGAPPIVVASKP